MWNFSETQYKLYNITDQTQSNKGFQKLVGVQSLKVYSENSVVSMLKIKAF